jgi:transcriptional regulator with XRE-family HTH domain
MSSTDDETSPISNKRNTAAIDLYIGERVRLRRMQVGMSQDQLGKVLGVTFQQIQKYEKGANRISAGRLYRIAGALECSVMLFFEGLDLIDAPTSTPFSQFISTKDGVAMVEAMLKIRTQELRRTVIDIAQKLARAVPAESEAIEQSEAE